MHEAPSSKYRIENNNLQVTNGSMRSLVTLRRRGTEASGGAAHRSSISKVPKLVRILPDGVKGIVAVSKLTSTLNTDEAPGLGPVPIANLSATVKEFKGKRKEAKVHSEGTEEIDQETERQQLKASFRQATADAYNDDQFQKDIDKSIKELKTNHKQVGAGLTKEKLDDRSKVGNQSAMARKFSTTRAIKNLKTITV